MLEDFLFRRISTRRLVDVKRSAGGCGMLWLLLCVFPPLDGSRTVAQDVAYTGRHEAVAVKTRPHIYFCRSPNMEDFSCWWRPLDNLTDGEQVTYALSYSQDNGPRQQCPDYVSAGPFSCHLDSSRTSVWKIYCMSVTAVTARQNYTSQEHCLDVADIVQTEAPVNLTYELRAAGGDEVGHSALLAWTYPVPSDLQYGWITLVYELQYRRATEPDNWKVKQPLREPLVELLGLPVGDYVVRVRCRSHNYGLWSEWSSALPMSLPAGPPPPGKPQVQVLVLVLVTGVAVVALLLILFGAVHQGKRIKDYFLPPIPKPRIIGIDPLLLKKGNLEEINHHFSTFHSYSPPSYTEDVWEQVSSGDVFLSTAKEATDQEKAGRHRLSTRRPPSYVRSVSPYCSSPPRAVGLTPAAPSLRWRPEVVSLPGTEYSVMGRPGLPDAVAAKRSPQDFYTCVQLMHESGEVHLVPCLPPAYCREFPPLPRVDSDAAEEKEEEEEEEEEEEKKLADCQARTNEGKDGGGAAAPLLPVTADRTRRP